MFVINSMEGDIPCTLVSHKKYMLIWEKLFTYLILTKVTGSH